MSVDNLPAVCHNLTCDFSYILPDGEITGFTFDEATSRLQLVGVNLPSVISNISKIEFALAECLVDQSTLSASKIDCTLQKEPTCGDYLPILTSALGVIPNNASLRPRTILCAVSQSAPTSGLNLLGGDNITISGTFLPHNLETSTVLIKFSDN